MDKYNLLKSIDDPILRLETMMEMGNELPHVPDGVRAIPISGCASQVEIYRDANNNLYANADSAIVRGILAVLLELANGKTPEQVRDENLREKFNALNLNLGTGRMNGTESVIRFLENVI